MSLRDLKAQLARLKTRAERRDAPTLEEYWAAARRETARRLRSAYERLARIPGNGSPAPHPGREGRDLLLANDTPEQAEADRQVVERWEKANGKADIRSHAEQARARLLRGR